MDTPHAYTDTLAQAIEPPVDPRPYIEPLLSITAALHRATLMAQMVQTYRAAFSVLGLNDTAEQMSQLWRFSTYTADQMIKSGHGIIDVLWTAELRSMAATHVEAFVNAEAQYLSVRSTADRSMLTPQSRRTS